MISPAAAARLVRRDARVYRKTLGLTGGAFFVEPLLFVAGFGLGVGAFVGDQILGLPYVVYVAPGMAAASVMIEGTLESAFGTLIKLRRSQLLQGVVAAPLEPADIAVAEVGWYGARASLYGVAFLAITALLGLVRSPWALAAPAILLLLGWCFAAIGVAVGAAARDFSAPTFLHTGVVNPMLLFGGVFYPVANLPALAESLVRLTPLYHGVVAVRALAVLGDPVAALTSALWLIGFLAVAVPVAIWFVQRRLVV